MLRFAKITPQCTLDDVGLIPYMLDENDSDSAAKQLDKNYTHGGCWRPMEGFTLNNKLQLCYPEDPPLDPLAMASLRDEVIIVYPHAWVVVRNQKTLKFEVCRMD